MDEPCPPYPADLGIVRSQYEAFGQRYMRYRRDFAATGRQELIPQFPLYVMLEQTFRCNLRCPSCLQGHAKLRARHAHGVTQMSQALFTRVLEECREHGCPSMAMHNIDEPLLVDDIGQRVSAAKDAGIMDVLLTTNGQLLDAELARELIDAGLTHILFSIDAATPKTYAATRPTADWNRLLQVVQLVRELRDARPDGLPRMRASFVLSRLNQHETEDFRRLFSPLVDVVEIQPFYALGASTHKLAPAGSRTEAAESFRCSEPFRKLVVRANGDVMPCCSIHGYDLVLGNIDREGLLGCWRSPRMVELRRGLATGTPTSVCRSCIADQYAPPELATCDPEVASNAD